MAEITTIKKTVVKTVETEEEVPALILTNEELAILQCALNDNYKWDDTNYGYNFLSRLQCTLSEAYVLPGDGSVRKHAVKDQVRDKLRKGIRTNTR